MLSPDTDSREAPFSWEALGRYQEEQRKKPELDYFRFPLLPFELSEAQHDEMTRASTSLISALVTAKDLCLTDRLVWDGRPLTAWLDLPPHALYWIRRHHRSRARVVWGRPDFLLAPQGPRILEANLASAAGYALQVSRLGDYYAENPLLEDRLVDRDFLDPIRGLAQSLAIDLRGGDTESLLFCDVFESKRHRRGETEPYGGLTRALSEHGLPVNSAFLEDLDFRPEGLYREGRRVTHVFMSYYNPHVFNRWGDFLPLWDLADRGHLRIIDGLDEVLLSNKILLAFLSEYGDRIALPSQVQRDLARYLPWTRLLRPAVTDFHGESLELERLARERPELFVLKRAQSAESAEVYIGRSIPAAEWSALVDRAMESPRWILQEYVDAPFSDLRIWNEDERSVEIVAGQAVVSPFLGGEIPCGYLVRYCLEKGESLNVKGQTLNLLGTAAIRRQGLGA